MNLVDSHCHLDMLAGQASGLPVADAVRLGKEAGVCYFLNVCVSIKEFSKNLETAHAYPCVGTSVGLHPNDDEEEVDVDELVKLAQDDKVVAIGETGLDYYRTSGDTSWQRDRFRRHIQAAIRVKKPLIIHTRVAKNDTIQIMREESANKAGGVMHCFTEDWVMAKQALDLGFYISFSGIVTFKNAEVIQDTARKVPSDRLLIETDSPYLAPNPKRGKMNEPAFVRYTLEYLAGLRGEQAVELAQTTTNNFFELFKGAVRPDV